MKIEIVTFLSLVGLAHLLLFLKPFLNGDVDNESIVAYYKQPAPNLFDKCTIPKHTLTMAAIKPGVISRAVCVEKVEVRHDLYELVGHLYLVTYKENVDALVAANFGVDVRVGYMARGNVTAINPVFIRGSGRKYCVEMVNGVKVRKEGRFEVFVFSIIDVEALDARKEITSVGAEACIMQSMFEKMNGIP